MSGGHYNYAYYHLDELADQIEGDFINDGKYLGEDWSHEISNSFDLKYPNKEYDRLEDATLEEKPIILNEIKSLIRDLRKCSKRAKELEWYMSGDTGATSFLRRLNE